MLNTKEKPVETKTKEEQYQEFKEANENGVYFLMIKETAKMTKPKMQEWLDTVCSLYMENPTDNEMRLHFEILKFLTDRRP